jgi:hypothetical protein
MKDAREARFAVSQRLVLALLRFKFLTSEDNRSRIGRNQD